MASAPDPAASASVDGRAGARTPAASRRADWPFMRGHPARWIALGFGSGLSPWAPGTAGTLWAWGVFVLLAPWLSGPWWLGLLAISATGGWWACTRTAQHLGIADPGAIVWDEVLAFWLVLWWLAPAGFWPQLAAFALFRLFDAVKPGPVGWADARYKQRPGTAIGWREGFGILFDDLVAAACTVGVLMAWRALT